MNEQVLTGVVCFLIGVVLAFIVFQLHLVVRKFQKMEDDFEAIVSRSRHTGSTVAGIEDMQAMIMRLQRDRMYEGELLSAIQNTLGKMRQGPYSYDPNTPCVTRKEK